MHLQSLGVMTVDSMAKKLALRKQEKQLKNVAGNGYLAWDSWVNIHDRAVNFASASLEHVNYKAGRCMKWIFWHFIDAKGNASFSPWRKCEHGIELCFIRLRIGKAWYRLNEHCFELLIRYFEVQHPIKFAFANHPPTRRLPREVTTLNEEGGGVVA